MLSLSCLLTLFYITASIDRAQSIFSHVPVNGNHHVDTATSQLHYNIHNPLANTLSVPSLGLNVLDYGAKGDRKTDNTKAFNNALQAAISTDHGGYVFVPSGQYLFEGSITIPTGVTLIGTYMFPPMHTSNTSNGITWNDLTDGSILGIHTSSNTPFIEMKYSSTIKGFSIFYPDQICTNKPIEYAPTIQTTGPQTAIMDLELINSYFGISASPASVGNAARHYIARIYGGPIKTGLFIDNCHDNGRVENIHFKSDWSCPSGSTITEYTAKHGISFIIGDTDWQYMFNTLSSGYAGGYNFVSTGAANNAPNGDFVNIGTHSATNYSIKVDQTKPWGLSIINGEFSTNGTGVIVSESNNGNVHLTNCIFIGANQYIAQIYGTFSTSFENCEFQQWDSSNPAIMSNNGIVRIIGNNFYQQNALIEFKTGTTKAIVVGNSFVGKHTIQADNGVDVA
eukprot:714035_1